MRRPQRDQRCRLGRSLAPRFSRLPLVGSVSMAGLRRRLSRLKSSLSATTARVAALSISKKSGSACAWPRPPRPRCAPGGQTPGAGFGKAAAGVQFAEVGRKGGYVAVKRVTGRVSVVNGNSFFVAESAVASREGPPSSGSCPPLQRYRKPPIGVKGSATEGYYAVPLRRFACSRVRVFASMFGCLIDASRGRHESIRHRNGLCPSTLSGSLGFLL
jgi:hypothetical protein